MGIDIVRTHESIDCIYKDYIHFERTLKEAEKAGLSVGDYIERKFNVPGTYERTIEKMAELGVFKKNIDSVCKIGPGSGRYLEETLRICNPKHYEIYETAANWAQWLVKRYHVIAQPCDGVSLAGTPSGSIDLVQSHKVFCGLPFLTIVKYFFEMARVTGTGGKVVFDILDEDCMDITAIEKWLKVNTWNWIPTLVPKKYAVDFFTKRGFSLSGSFSMPLRPGVTECMVFSR